MASSAYPAGSFYQAGAGRVAHVHVARRVWAPTVAASCRGARTCFSQGVDTLCYLDFARFDIIWNVLVQVKVVKRLSKHVSGVSVAAS